MRTALIAAALLIAAPAVARDDGRFTDSRYKAWFSAQQNARGQFCCSDADGHPFYGDYRITADGGVDITDGGKVYHLEPYKVLHGPNPTGHAVWWFAEYQGAQRVTYCFSGGSGG